jgi:hypothetical protein
MYREVDGDAHATAALGEGLCPECFCALTPCLSPFLGHLHGYCFSCELWYISPTDGKTH